MHTRYGFFRGKTDGEPEPFVLPGADDSAAALREEIMDEIAQRPAEQYELTRLLWDDADACFPGNSFRWDGAFFKLDLIAQTLFVNLSTYPNQFGACRETNDPITPERFHQIAEQYHFRPELQSFKTEEDWARLFNEDLKAAVSRARVALQERKARQKAMETAEFAIPIAEYAGKTPAGDITEVVLDLWQLYGHSCVELKQENGRYRLLYLSHESCRRDLSDPEAAWVEHQVAQTLENTDETQWHSLPGGDMMRVSVIRGGEVCESRSGDPLKKYMDLQDDLRKLAKYGSK